MSDPNGKVKSRQRNLMFVAVGVILVLVMGSMVLFESKKAPRVEKPKTVAITTPGTIDDKDAWRSQEAAKQKMTADQIAELKSALARQDEEQKRLKDELEKAKTSVDASALSQPLPGAKGSTLSSPYSNTASMSSTGMTTGAKPGVSTTLNAPLNQALPEEPKQEMEIIKFNSGTASGNATNNGKGQQPGFNLNGAAKKTAQADSSTAGKGIEFIPAGSFVRVAMLNGVDAPTGGQAQSNPLPIALHVLDTANLANKYKLNIKDCRFIAASWGDLSSERGMARTESLTCIINGETVEMPVKGQVIGEDGKAGMRGRLVTKQGQILANALLAGIAGGIGQAFQQSATTQSVSPLGTTTTVQPGDVSRAAIGAGVGNAGNALEQYYLRAADKLFPVIEIDGGRTVEVLITKGAVYTGRTASFNENYRSMFRRSGSTARDSDED